MFVCNFKLQIEKKVLEENSVKNSDSFSSGFYLVITTRSYPHNTGVEISFLF